MTLLAERHFILRHVIRLAPLIALVAAVDRAEAACDPVSPVSNVTVTCTGTTTNANGTNGYGTDTDNGNTYNITSGASVSGTDNGLIFYSRNRQQLRHHHRSGRKSQRHLWRDSGHN